MQIPLIKSLEILAYSANNIIQCHLLLNVFSLLVVHYICTLDFYIDLFRSTEHIKERINK